jgi:hypothetical protein
VLSGPFEEARQFDTIGPEYDRVVKDLILINFDDANPGVVGVAQPQSPRQGFPQPD